MHILSSPLVVDKVFDDTQIRPKPLPEAERPTWQPVLLTFTQSM